jgi:replicative superfamily II helicase
MNILKKWFLTEEEKDVKSIIKQIEKNKNKIEDDEMIFQMRAAGRFFEAYKDKASVDIIINLLKNKGYNAEIYSYYNVISGKTFDKLYEDNVSSIKINKIKLEEKRR